jgi:hypothetical protein
MILHFRGLPGLSFAPNLKPARLRGTYEAQDRSSNAKETANIKREFPMHSRATLCCQSCDEPFVRYMASIAESS